MNINESINTASTAASSSAAAAAAAAPPTSNPSCCTTNGTADEVPTRTGKGGGIINTDSMLSLSSIGFGIDSSPSAALGDATDAAIRAVRDAMDRLPENYRIALEWKYVDRLSVKVIAERLATTEKSVEAVLFRARNALRDGLSKEKIRPPGHDKKDQHASASAKPIEKSQETNGGSNDSDDSSPENQPSIFFASRLAGEN